MAVSVDLGTAVISARHSPRARRRRPRGGDVCAAMVSAPAPASALEAPDEDVPDLRTPQGVDRLRARLEDPDWRVRVRALGAMATALAPPERAIDAEALAELRHEDAAFREELSDKLERDREEFEAVGEAMGWSSRGAGTRHLNDSLEETTLEDDERAFRASGAGTSPGFNASPGGRRSRGASPARTGADDSAAAARASATTPASPMKSPRKRSGSLCGCGSATDAAEPTRVSNPPSGGQAVVESAFSGKETSAETRFAAGEDANARALELEPAADARDVRVRTADASPETALDPPSESDSVSEELPRLDPAAVTRLLHACAPCVARAVEDLREDVRVAACGAIKAACDAATDRIELAKIVSPVAADVFAPALLRVASREADPAASNAAYFALVRCASACVEPSFLRRVCDAYAQCRAGAPGFEPRGVRVRKELPPRNELLRRRALELVARVLADWPSRVLTDQNADCLACATRCLLSGLADPCMGVRRAARACFEVYEAVWPREAESLVFELDPHGRQLVLGGALSGDPGDERNDTGSRWALGGARAFARRETRDGRVAASAERDARVHERDAYLDSIPNEDERRLAMHSPDRRGRSIAASRPVEWPAPTPSPKAPAPPPLWDERDDDRSADAMLSPVRARYLAEFERDAAAHAAASAKPLAAYYEAARRRGTREVSKAGRYTRWLEYPKSHRFGYSAAPEMIEKYSNLETRLEDDVQKLNLRLREAHAQNVRARVHGAYAETLENMVTDRMNRAVGAVVDGKTRKTVRPPSPAGSVDSEGIVEARWREPARGYVRDLATGAFVETEAYLERWAVDGKEPREGRGKENEHDVAPGDAGGIRKGAAAEPRTAEARARALRRIRAEWRDEAAEVFGAGNAVTNGNGNGNENETRALPAAATKAPPTEADKRASFRKNGGGALGGRAGAKTWTPARIGDRRRSEIEVEFDAEARAARLRAAAAQAKALREARALAYAKEEEEEKRYRELHARQDRELRARQEARIAETEMRREDDARALELLRLRNENALLKHKYDALFHERLIKPGDVVVDQSMSPGEARRLTAKKSSSKSDEPKNDDAKQKAAAWRGVLDPGERVIRTRVFRGATVRGEGGVDVDVAPSKRDPLSYPGSFQREIEARKATIVARRKRAPGATRDESGGAEKNKNALGRWDGVVDWR